MGVDSYMSNIVFCLKVFRRDNKEGQGSSLIIRFIKAVSSIPNQLNRKVGVP